MKLMSLKAVLPLINNYMTKEKITISYLPRWNNEGTVYRKTYTISLETFKAFKIALEAEQAMEKNYERSFWLKKSLEMINNDKQGIIVFFNLTQAHFFTNWILKLSDVSVNKKRALYEANTCLLIKS